jgi:hypothetical protein
MICELALRSYQKSVLVEDLMTYRVTEAVVEAAVESVMEAVVEVRYGWMDGGEG